MELEIVIITLSMFVLALSTIFFPHIQKYYEKFFLFGTGALVGLCFFHLFPDVFELGGVKGLSFVLVAWVLYSLLHLLHSHHHLEHGQHESASIAEHNHSPYLFLLAISTHCLTTGLFLGVSGSFSHNFTHSIFIGLLAHKVYEVMIVTSVLLNYKKSHLWTFTHITGYLLSFPLGFYLSKLFSEYLTSTIILVISALALGSLIGCLVFDFLLPNLRKIKQKTFVEVLPFLVGILATMAFS